MKQWAIITYKHGIYELPNDLGLSQLCHMKTRVSFKYFVSYCSCSMHACIRSSRILKLQSDLFARHKQGIQPPIPRQCWPARSRQLWQQIAGFAKSHAMRACAPTWPTRQSAGAPPFLRANAPRVCQLIIFTCQRAIRGPSALTWRAKVPKGMPIFQTLLRELSILYYYIKNSTFYLIL